MVLLTIYRKKTEEKTRRCSRTYASVSEAVKAGQESGCLYDIYDMNARRTIDWSEINEREDDGWYYDEADFTWKKSPAEELAVGWMRDLPLPAFSEGAHPSPHPQTLSRCA